MTPAGIHARAGVPVWAAPMSARDTEDLTAQLRGLPADTGAIFLTHTDPDRARAAQQALHEASGRRCSPTPTPRRSPSPAALLTAVAHAGHTPATSRVVIAGSATMPDLGPC